MRWLRLFISIVHELPIAVLACDATLPSSPILFANAYFERLTGYANAEVVGTRARAASSKLILSVRKLILSVPKLI